MELFMDRDVVFAGNKPGKSVWIIRKATMRNLCGAPAEADECVRRWGLRNEKRRT